MAYNLRSTTGSTTNRTTISQKLSSRKKISELHSSPAIADANLHPKSAKQISCGKRQAGKGDSMIRQAII